MKFPKIILISAIILPSFALAFDLSATGLTFSGVIKYILSIFDLLLPILFALAFIFFFWGLSKFILNNTGNKDELKKGQDYMMWGILAIFILVSFRGIIAFISKDLEINNPKDTSTGWGVRLPE